MKWWHVTSNCYKMLFLSPSWSLGARVSTGGKADSAVHAQGSLALCWRGARSDARACVGTSRGRQGSEARTALIIRIKPDSPSVLLRGGGMSSQWVAIFGRQYWFDNYLFFFFSYVLISQNNADEKYNDSLGVIKMSKQNFCFRTLTYRTTFLDIVIYIHTWKIRNNNWSKYLKKRVNNIDGSHTTTWPEKLKDFNYTKERKKTSTKWIISRCTPRRGVASMVMICRGVV